MPKKRDRKTDASTRTLHDFFKPSLAAGNSSNVRKTSTEKARVVATTRQTHEVIVIDSDSDDEVQFVQPKRQRLCVPSSGDASVGLSRGSSQSTHANHDTLHFKENVPSSSRDVFFGEPFLLKPSASELEQLASTSEPVFSPCSVQLPSSSGKQPRATFGPPCLLIESSPDHLGSPESQSEPRYDLQLAKWEERDDELGDQTGDCEELTYKSITDQKSWCNVGEPDQSQVALNPNPEAVLSSPVQAETKHDIKGKSKSDGGSHNAFSFLMSSLKENDAWKEATVAEDKSFRPNATIGTRRKAPFYKVLQGMPIAVDAFKYGKIPGVSAYFLTHGHSDHYTNLSSNWKNGPIYCSEGTANLIAHMLSVDREWIHPLPMDIPTVIPGTGGVTVTPIDANHCPGSCIFLFEGRQTVNAGDSNYKSSFVGSSKVFRYLHCGDFRASPQHVLHPSVHGKTIDHVYLDTTYLDSRYTFPPQSLVISACADLVKRIFDQRNQPQAEIKSAVLSWVKPARSADTGNSKPLVVIGTYSIGKERIVKAVAQAINSKVYCEPRKSALLRCQADPELDALLTSEPDAALVHLVPLATVTSDRIKIYAERFKGKHERVVAFRPTGWTFTQAAGSDQSPTIPAILSKHSQQNFTHTDLQPSRNSSLNIQMFSVPYSEHSSFYELTCFAMSFNWTKMIATVNVGSESSRGKMARWVSKWEAERRKRGKDIIVPHRHPEYW